MVGIMNLSPGEVEANCAICGAPPVPECPHEGERLELALNQAMQRWLGFVTIREWVLNHARNQIISTFRQLRAMRLEAHRSYLQTLPYYTLYHKFNGAPPLQPAQLQIMHGQIQQANANLQQGIDQDWRTSCLRYPEVLDYYFSLVIFEFPPERDPRIQDPRFGSTPKEPAARKIKERRPSIDMGKEHRKKDRRRSRGRTPPPAAPMPGTYRR